MPLTITTDPAKAAPGSGSFVSRRSISILLLLLGVAGIEALLILYCLGLGEVPILGGDGLGYHQITINMLDHGAFSFASAPTYEPTVLRTPGYPGFLAGVYTLAGRSVLAVRIAQFLLLATTAWLLYHLAVRFVSNQVALVAALLCATYPPFVFVATYHLTETLATFLTVLFVLFWILAIQKKGSNTCYWLILISGIAAGTAALVRPSLLLAPAIFVGSALLPQMLPTWRMRFGLLACFSAGFLLCTLPWCMRTTGLTRRWLGLATGSGGSLYVSVQQYAGEISYQIRLEEWERIIADDNRRHEIARKDLETSAKEKAEFAGVPSSVAVELIVDRKWAEDARNKFKTLSLGQVLRSIPLRIAYLWSTGDMSPWAAEGVFHHLVQVEYLVLIFLGLLGCWWMRKHLLAQWPVWSVALYLTALHLVFHIEPRYSFPARPFLLLYPAVAFARIAALWKRSPALAQGAPTLTVASPSLEARSSEA